MRAPKRDPRSAKDQLLGMMRAAGRMADPIQARRAALGIFRDNLTSSVCSETELLAEFSKSAGRDYVDLWTREPLPRNVLAELLAVHLAHGWTPEDDPMPEIADAVSRVLPLARRCLAARADQVRRLRPDIAAALERAIDQEPGLQRLGGEIDAEGALAWLRRYRPHQAPEILTPSLRASGQASIMTMVAVGQMQVPKLDQKVIVELIQQRHPDVGDKDRLYAFYATERSQLPAHYGPIKRDTFRKLIRRRP